MTSNLRLLVASTASLFACSTLVGADFDDRHEGEPAHRGGETATTGGATSGGRASGGTTVSTGGNPLQGGSGPSTGGAASGGAASGGTTGGGGGSSGGVAGQTSTGGTPATGGTNTASGGVGPGGGGGEAGDGVFGGEGVIAPGGAGGAPEGGGAGDAGGGPGPGTPPVIVLNEVKGQGSGDDYIEIYNRGPGALDLEGYGLSDQSNTFFFPAGATIAQGGHVLLLLGQPQPLPNSAFMCFTPSPCYHATWGISQDGESVYLRGRQNQVLDTTTYPNQNGANAITNDQTWGRLPDGEGAFRATRPTPEAINQAP
jgi:hypothetical protein